ncbi:MAG: FAD-binding protein [Lautropia sp.]|nr:FAD-binding protein [Lautropia sp.]
MGAATPTSDPEERLPLLVQRLRRQVRGEVMLVDGTCRLLPRDETDVMLALALARDLVVPVVFGAGAARTPAALQVDPRAYLGQMVQFDAERGTIVVQPGVRLADLNRWLRPSGWWLPMEASPLSGSTVGNLVGLDCLAACRHWGGMVDALLGIEAILDDGTPQRFGPFGEHSTLRLTSARAGGLVSGLFQTAAGVRGEIADHWPGGQRVPDGYRLDCFYPRPERPYTADGAVNLAHLLAGSAGSLAWFSRICLRLRRRPAVSHWGVFPQPDHLVALRKSVLLQQSLSASAVLLLDREDMRRLAQSRHPDDVALWAPSARHGSAAAAALLVRVSGDSSVRVRAAYRRVLEVLAGGIYRPAAGGQPMTDEGLQSCAGPAGRKPHACDRRGASVGGAVWQQILGELVTPVWEVSTSCLPLWPMEPERLADQIAVIGGHLGALAEVVSWRGQIAGGEVRLQVAGPPAARQAVWNRVLEMEPERWTPALRRALADVRRQFDPLGILPAVRPPWRVPG